MKRFLLIGLALGLSPAAAYGQSYSIKAKTVMVAPGDVRSDVAVNIKDGKIVSIGAPVEGATLIDGGEGVITPGLIDASTSYGMYEVSLEKPTVEGRMGGQAVHADYQAADGLHRDSVRFPILRARGITHVISGPNGGLIPGASVGVSTTSPAKLVNRYAALHIRIGGSAGNGSRGLAIARLDRLFADAKVYASNKAAYQSGRLRPLSANAQNLAALADVVKRRVPVVVDAHRRSDIEAVMRLAKKHQLNLVISGGSEAWLVAKQLAAAKIPVIVNPADNLPSTFDQVGIRDDLAKRLAEAKVRLILSTRSGAPYLGQLTQAAATAMRHGLSREDAMRALTETPAKVFAIGSGSLAVGGEANLVVWSADPMTAAAKAKHVFIDGVAQSLTTRHDRLFKRYRNLKKR